MYYNKGILKKSSEGGNNQLQEYFCYIASNQQMSHSPSHWDSAKTLFIEIIDAAERYHLRVIYKAKPPMEAIIIIIIITLEIYN